MPEESETGGEKRKRERATQPRRNAASVLAYAEEKLAEFMVIYGKLKYAAEVLKPLGADVEIVPHTSNLDAFMLEIDKRADEFVFKAERAKKELDRERKKKNGS